MLVLKACDNSSMMHSILFIKNIIGIIFVVAPIVLALLFTVDLAKNVFAKDEQENQKNLKLGIRRIIYSLILLFVPLLVETFMGMISGYSKVASCYDLATDAKVNELKAKEDAEYEKTRAEKLRILEEEKNAVAAEQEAERIAAQEALQAVQQQSQNNSNNSSNNTTTNVGEKVVTSADKLARGIANSRFRYLVSSGLHSSYNKAVKDGFYKVNCATYASWVYIDAGVLKSGEHLWFNHGKYGSTKVKNNVQKAQQRGSIKIYTDVNKKMKDLVKSGAIQPGDMLGNTDQTHTFIYAGKKSGKDYVYSVGHSGTDGFTYSEIYHKSPYANRTIGVIIRPLKAN